MGQYVELGRWRDWYEERGSGDPVVLLHGGLSTNEMWGAQMPALAKRFHVLAPERHAHGHSPDVEGPLSYDDMAAETIAFLEAVLAQPAHLVGWSDGGIVGLLVAISRPDLVRKLVVIGTNYDTAGLAPRMLEGMQAMAPDAPDMAMFRDLYTAASPDGPEHWPAVVEKSKTMFTTQPHIPVGDLDRIQAPTLVLVGDDDIIDLSHTVALFHALPNAQLAVVPGTSHGVPMEKPELVNRLILDFLENEPAPTLMPVRRVGQAH